MQGATIGELLVEQVKLFQSTLPMQGATKQDWRIAHNAFQSTLPMQGATRAALEALNFVQLFQSTLPMQGATYYNRLNQRRNTYFNPRSQCRERLTQEVLRVFGYTFQSTLPMQGATGLNARRPSDDIFQSTLPMQGATLTSPLMEQYTFISIHAPNAGSDSHQEH